MFVRQFYYISLAIKFIYLAIFDQFCAEIEEQQLLILNLK